MASSTPPTTPCGETHSAKPSPPAPAPIATATASSTRADYDNWVLDFGTTVGSLPGAGAAAAVPEPPTCRLAIFAIGLFYLGSRVSSRR